MSLALVACVSWGAGACSLVRGGIDGPREAWEHDGVIYRARTDFFKTSPVRIRTVVTASNVRREPVELRTSSCPVFVRLYRTPERQGFPAWARRVWMGARRTGSGSSRADVGCGIEGLPIVVPPGAMRRVTTVVVDPGAFGDTIPPGLWFFTAIVELPGRTIELSSGAAELPAPSTAAHAVAKRLTDRPG